MSTKGFLPLIPLWLVCGLIVMRCSVAIGLELAYIAPSYLWIGFQVFVAMVMTGVVYASALLACTRDRERGSAKLTLMVLLSLVGAALLSPGCAALKGEGKAALKTAVDCTAKEAIAMTKEWSPTLEQVLTRATGGDGSIDWPSVKDATRSLSAIGWCALENTVARLLSHVPAAGAPMSSPLQAQPDELKRGLAELRREKFGDATFKTE